MHSAAIERDHLVASARRDDLLIGAARVRREPPPLGGSRRRIDRRGEIQRRLGAVLVALGQSVQQAPAGAGD